MARRPMTDAEREANAARVARWRERHIRSVDGQKERLMLVLDIGTKARLQRIADHYGYRSITAMLEQWSMQTASAIDDETESKAKARNYPAHPETN